MADRTDIGALRLGSHDPNRTQASETPLHVHLAAARGKVDEIKLLLRAIQDEGKEKPTYILKQNEVGDLKSMMAWRLRLLCGPAVPFFFLSLCFMHAWRSSSPGTMSDACSWPGFEGHLITARAWLAMPQSHQTM